MDGLRKYWMERLQQPLRNEELTWIERKVDLHERRSAHVARITGDARVYRTLQIGQGEWKVDYMLKVDFLIKQGKSMYIESEENQHRSHWYKGDLVKDEWIPNEMDSADHDELSLIEGEDDYRFNYDRQKAVQYANRWWNSYNPAYRKFENDCTNYISQCLRAGGSPMWGSPKRSRGWWYGSTWSYSWAVANALRWYLSGSTKGLKGRAVERASDLMPGDVICYDFEGDGRWNHNTIVVAKDAFNEPLVNAHTSNSYHRYWDYEDSTAYTPNITYKFFRIGE
ncbi:hypothetical protein N781_06270 [Pontibacillus halophilus JSM 076056 = DSM 19796]|uniref:Putative amidase domain-containing protein n=1 Tax=Pontibacillus halophilus JSM 076056 = DSM 19796 TaxID=1385510 RepID=A0A0A5I4C4_9BACI|nr:amidase domain-containing protein [Pontibacillus halophilus]KGX90677.1 hypothetical protein N781_06270 [Pontibacillus halophilus JSM 076056 = DSM 19796]